MANYTVISNSPEKNQATVVVEFPVPGTGTNVAGLQWRSVVAEVRAFDGATGETVNPRKRTNGTHIAALDAGQIVELLFTVEYDANLTNGQKATFIDGAVAARITEYQTEFTNSYEFYGTERSV